MAWHGYIGIENLNLTPAQRNTLVDALKQLGPASDPSPARLMHHRTRLDNQAVILEALFNETNTSIAKMKERLGNIFGVDPDTIDHSTTIYHFNTGNTPITTFSLNDTDYFRFALFGGTDATWQESGDECRAYLKTYIDQWEEDIEELLPPPPPLAALAEFIPLPIRNTAEIAYNRLATTTRKTWDRITTWFRNTYNATRERIIDTWHDLRGT